MCSQQDTPALSLSAAILLGVAGTATATLGVIIAAQSAVPLRVYEGTTALLAALVALTGTGTIICIVAAQVMRGQHQMEERVMRRLDRLERLLPQHVGRPHLSLVEEASVGIDPEAIESARKIARDLMR